MYGFMRKLILKLLRICIYEFYLKRQKKIVIASSGRSGSTLLFEAVYLSYIRNVCGVSPDSCIGRLLLPLIPRFIVRLKDCGKARCVVCKTHDVWNESYCDDALFLFIHGDPLDSAYSVWSIFEKVVNDTEKQTEFKKHQHHLRATGSYSDLFLKDVLNYREQIESWLTCNSVNVFSVAYEDLWDSTKEISSFIGFSLVLPEFIPRGKKEYAGVVNDDLFHELRLLRIKLWNKKKL